MFIAIAAVLSGCGAHTGAPPAIANFLIQPPQQLPTFELRDADQQPLARERFVGKWSLVFFGYTHCPDVCPATLAELARVYQLPQMPPEVLQQVQTLFISVDPARDSPALLKNFVRYFNPRFIAATGTVPQLNVLTEALGVHHARLTDQGAEYRVEHSAEVFVFDPQARLYAKFPPPHYADDIAKQLPLMIAYYTESQHAASN